jgi:hypothetical protein
MAEPVLPKEVEDSLGWLMREGGGLGWEGLVDYGVHLAISESLIMDFMELGALTRHTL